MYSEFYSLNGMPFQLTPDSRFFFGSTEHNKAMAFLNYGISQGEGFVVVTGEVGAGKTTLVDHLLSTLDPTRYITGRIVTTQLNSYDMLRMVGAAFQIAHFFLGGQLGKYRRRDLKAFRARAARPCEER